MNIPWIPMIIWLQSIEIHWPHPSSKAQVRSTAELLVAVRGLHRHPVADAEVERPGAETLLEAEGFRGRGWKITDGKIAGKIHQVAMIRQVSS